MGFLKSPLFRTFAWCLVNFSNITSYPELVILKRSVPFRDHRVPPFQKVTLSADHLEVLFCKLERSRNLLIELCACSFVGVSVLFRQNNASVYIAKYMRKWCVQFVVD